MDKPLIVNLFGGPGAGKSTTATGVFSLLKLHGVNAEYVPEFAKDLTWEERAKTLQNQIYLFGKQYHRSWRLFDQVDVIITDAPFILGLVYGIFDLSMVQVMMGRFEECNNLNFFLRRVKKYEPKGRNQTFDEAKLLDGKIYAMLTAHGIEHTEAEGNHTAINMIASYILRKFEKGLKYEITPLMNPEVHEI